MKNMNIKPINHVVLYAKNFYRHTGNLIKDLQRFCQLDGAYYNRINTPEKLLAFMLKNYKNWVYSLDNTKHEADYLRSQLENDQLGVAWCDDPIESVLWSILISYSGSYIPLRSLDNPKYDKYHLPQYNIKEGLFSKTDTFDDLIRKADQYLHKPILKSLDDIVNNLLLNKLDYESIGNALKELGEPMTEKEIGDEIWDAYTELVEDNLNDKDELTPGYFEKQSKHFFINLYINPLNNHISDVSIYFKIDSLEENIEGCTKEDIFKKAKELIENYDYSKIDFEKNTKLLRLVDTNYLDLEYTKEILSNSLKEAINLFQKEDRGDFFSIGIYCHSILLKLDMENNKPNMNMKILFDPYLCLDCEESELFNNRATLTNSAKY